MTSKHIVVSGRVQGVNFRSAAQDAATDLGIAGWVRNRDDGSVEMLVEGDDDAVERMVGWARQGPSAAEVTDVDVTDTEPQGLSSFEQA
ncbi:acylphosphatase [Actinomycetospora cinnamomea]|uniref:Acylphosphatase n=1 Tax=Actinomycetospora cinnamomea TaxID=663609 RepID=A0A2U1E9A7_9PSEU|nr:acylphosphatase [Actinomycetospora cinnamomea]PVY96531.1 acylphosphatase [Actinomycetospora cinnamomea]